MKVVGIVSVCAGGSQRVFSKLMGYSLSHYQLQAPEIILHQVPFEEYQKAIDSKNHHAFERPLLKSLAKLNDCGADFVIVPNNTVQSVVNLVSSKSPIPILNLTEIVAQECKKQKIGKVLILGTSELINSGLYQCALEEQNIKSYLLDSTSMDLMNHEILSAILLGSQEFSVSAELDSVIRRIAPKYDAMLLACSELVSAYHGNLDILTIDPIELLAKAAAQEAMMK